MRQISSSHLFSLHNVFSLPQFNFIAALILAISILKPSAHNFQFSQENATFDDKFSSSPDGTWQLSNYSLPFLKDQDNLSGNKTVLKNVNYFKFTTKRGQWIQDYSIVLDSQLTSQLAQGSKHSALQF